MTLRTLNPRGDWVGLIEAIHAPASDESAWADAILETARSLFPRAAHLMTYSIDYGPAREFLGLPLCRPASMPIMSHFREVVSVSPEAWIPFHFGPPVLTIGEATPELRRDLADEIVVAHRERGYEEAVAIVAHPRPGTVAAFCALFDKPIDLSRTDRELLTRISLHLEASHRLRGKDATVVAEIGPSGVMPTAKLRGHVARIEEARKRGVRTSPEGTELWTALLEGRLSVVPRGNRYLVLDNPTPTYELRALTQRETAVLSLAARGCSSKQICYALGVSPALVSMSLRGAAAKLGVLTRTELVRLAALLVRDTRGLMDDVALTEAEQDVLLLLERGLGNREIAAIRMRSVRTIANQVAALLRKTGTSSRRQLVARRSTARTASQSELVARTTSQS